MTRRFWPIAEASQADYERLREASLTGTSLIASLSTCFERRGLAGLIESPSSDSEFKATLIGARRPPWSPHTDPRLESLAAAFELLLVSPDRATLDVWGVH